MEESKPNAIAKKENRELAKTISFGEGGFLIQNLAQATLVAETMLASKLVPAHFNSAAKIIVVAQAAKELGKPLWWGLNNMFVVNGKVGVAAAAVAGLVLESKVACQWEVTEEGTFPDDNFTVVITSKRVGHEKPVSTRFSVADAKTAGLWTKATWKCYPKTMLTWRAVTFHARLYYSDVLGGSYTDMELEDMKTGLPKPECDVKPRGDRRKTVESTDLTGSNIPKPADTKPLAETSSELPVTTVEPAEPNTDVDSDVAGSADAEEVEVVEEGSLLAEKTARLKLENDLDDLQDSYCEKEGDNFTEWAAEALCRGEDEVDSPEKFKPDMIEQLVIHLAEKGV